MSTFEDADAFLQFLTNMYIEAHTQRTAAAPPATFSSTQQHVLSGIFVYPVKSCQGFRVEDWPLTESGLYLDRQWAIKDASGSVLTQKKEPKLAEISTRIYRKSPEEEEEELLLSLQAPGMKALLVSIAQKDALQSRVEAWLMEFLGRRCKFVPCDMEPKREGPRNFSNKGGCLLISTESVKHLIRNDRSGVRSLSAKDDEDVLKACLQFRPNFVVGGGSAFEEESWSKVSIGGNTFDKTSDCNRCRMVCIDQKGTGDTTRYTDLLAAISKNPAKKKKGIVFGILLAPPPLQGHQKALLACGAHIEGL
jgi:molybdenum cofactor sulfurtransferase